MAGEIAFRDFGLAAEGRADGSAQRGEHGGPEGFEFGGDIGIGAAVFGRDRSGADMENEIVEVGIGLEGIGRGEQDGALEPELDGRALFSRFGQAEAGAAGQPGERVGEARGQPADLIEGKDAIVVGVLEELPLGGRHAGERDRGGVDELAEHRGGGRLARAGRSLDKEDGIGAGGFHSADEPGEDAVVVGVSGRVEEGTQCRQRLLTGRRFGRRGEGLLAAVGGKYDRRAGGNSPAGCGDVEGGRGWVLKMEEDVIGAVIAGMGSDPEVDGAPGAGARESQSAESVEDAADDLLAGNVTGALVIAIREPVDEGGGVDGNGEASDLEGHFDEGLVEVGAEQGSPLGLFEKDVERAVARLGIVVVRHFLYWRRTRLLMPE